MQYEIFSTNSQQDLDFLLEKLVQDMVATMSKIREMQKFDICIGTEEVFTEKIQQKKRFVLDHDESEWDAFFSECRTEI